MAGYILEFRDEDKYREVVEKIEHAKRALCDAMDAIIEAEDGGNEPSMNERGRYRGGRYRNGNYRDGNHRGFYHDDLGRVEWREGGRYDY